jgi:K+-transporting ATPase KdpF subunit
MDVNSQLTKVATSFLWPQVWESQPCWICSMSSWLSAPSRCSRWQSTLATGSEGKMTLIIDYVIGGAVALLLLGYLAYALLRPEKF